MANWLIRRLKYQFIHFWAMYKHFLWIISLRFSFSRCKISCGVRFVYTLLVCLPLLPCSLHEFKRLILSIRACLLLFSCMKIGCESNLIWRVEPKRLVLLVEDGWLESEWSFCWLLLRLNWEVEDEGFSSNERYFCISLAFVSNMFDLATEECWPRDADILASPNTGLLSLFRLINVVLEGYS